MYRCPCCGCHTLRSPGGEGRPCPLCLWMPDETYDLAEARHNIARYSVSYRPVDPRFAQVRHPILGPSGEYAIDRVALRGRAYVEFRAFGASLPERAQLTERLESLLETIRHADRLYSKRAL